MNMRRTAEHCGPDARVSARAFRRHRRRRHERHRRGAGQPRLPGVAAPTAGRERPRTSRRARREGAARPRAAHIDGRRRAGGVQRDRARQPGSRAAARERRIPVVPRAEMLGELMRLKTGIAVAGTHGKTTTTSLMRRVLAEGGLDPTFVIGGRSTRAGTNARLGAGRIPGRRGRRERRFVPAAAADRSRWSPTSTPIIWTTTAATSKACKQAFVDFLHHLPFYGARDPVHRRRRRSAH